MPITGKQVTFVAPCESGGLTHIILQGIEYELVDSSGNNLIEDAFVAEAMVSVILNVENHKAYIQNADISYKLKNSFACLSSSITEESVGSTVLVPEGVNRFASVTRIAGMSYRNPGSFLPYPYTETTVKKNGVTFTDNGDGSITLNGTSTASSTFKLCGNEVSSNLEVDSTYDILLEGKVNGISMQLQWYDIDGGLGNISFFPPMLWKEGNKVYSIAINVFSGYTFNNVVVRPILFKEGSSIINAIESTNIVMTYSSYRGIPDDSITTFYYFPSNLFPLRGVKEINSSLEVIGTHRDYVEFHKGLAYKYTVCEEFSFDGTEDWDSGYKSGVDTQYFSIKITNDSSKYVERAIVSNKYDNAFINSSTNKVGVDCFYSSTRGAFVIAVRPQNVASFKDRDSFKEYLNSNPIKVILARRTPVSEGNYSCNPVIEVVSKDGRVMFMGERCEELENTIEYYLNTNRTVGADVFVGHLNGSASKAITAKCDNQGRQIDSTYSLKPIISAEDIVAGETPLATGQSYHVYE